MDVIGIIMSAGKSSVDVALYTLLPIMVVMLIIMKYLEVRGILDIIVRWLAPLLKPFGLTGMSAFALIQINFVSFAAPLATLAIMDKRGVSDRQMAATLAMVFAMGQGNVFYPLTPFGLHWLAAITILLSVDSAPQRSAGTPPGEVIHCREQPGRSTPGKRTK